MTIGGFSNHDVQSLAARVGDRGLVGPRSEAPTLLEVAESALEDVATAESFGSNSDILPPLEPRRHPRLIVRLPDDRTDPSGASQQSCDTRLSTHRCRHHRLDAAHVQSRTAGVRDYHR